MNAKRFFFLSLCLFFVLSGLPAALASLGPTEELKPTLNKIIDILADSSLSGIQHKEERRAKIMAIATQGFDFPEMAKLVLGKTWNTIDQQQQTHFEQLFTKLLENTYIGKLESYSGQEVKFQDERIKGDKAQVSTVVDNNGVAIPVHYVMLQKESSWKVYDINIEGVSLVRNFREQFKSILRKEKFDGLVKVIEEKNASFSTEGSN
ncbi:MAG: ABC transporter substrate-binding protein [Proteobacteria bacterium]|nr:ABC transporter substrate-binding protein [Pseudomonadota bacterium]MBU1234493.1 ABC transporter substrate-binding protein [Pseudomonadota bacterium]MBU1417979.1 ABC transporter substrate-binding protein [Pseudomonadota bacterium]MBU1453546.1 ABC transporter substrate-binding protein [Pseudomonadota bacterium]